MADIDHFIKPPRPQRCGGELGDEVRERRHAADRRGPEALGLGVSALDGIEDIVVGELPFDRVEPLHPLGKSSGRRDGVAQGGVIQMAMGVDEPRQQRDLAQFANFLPRQRRKVGRPAQGRHPVA